MTDRGLSLCESIHGETHLETAVWLNNAAELLLLQKRYEESCHFFRQAHTTFLEYVSFFLLLSLYEGTFDKDDNCVKIEGWRRP